jgi:hypothetical protein
MTLFYHHGRGAASAFERSWFGKVRGQVEMYA